eukprot:4229156-Amphidinium_carterae.1
MQNLLTKRCCIRLAGRVGGDWIHKLAENRELEGKERSSLPCFMGKGRKQPWHSCRSHSAVEGQRH